MNIIRRSDGSDGYLNVPRFDREAGGVSSLQMFTCLFYIISSLVLSFVLYTLVKMLCAEQRSGGVSGFPLYLPRSQN